MDTLTQIRDLLDTARYNRDVADNFPMHKYYDGQADAYAETLKLIEDANDN